MADNIRTVTGIMMDPLNPKPEDIEIEDIAHALSFLCRANGHYRKFYSIGAHCINCYEEAVNRQETVRIQMACLIHDATEAYMSDVTRPVKKSMPDYQEFEAKLADVIYEKFLGSLLTEYEKVMVKTIDDAMLYYEFYEFTAFRLMDEPPYTAATPDFFQGPMDMVEKKYIDIFKDLSDKIKNGVKREQDDKPKLKLDMSRLYKVKESED